MPAILSLKKLSLKKLPEIAKCVSQLSLHGPCRVYLKAQPLYYIINAIFTGFPFPFSLPSSGHFKPLFAQRRNERKFGACYSIVLPKKLST